MAKQTTHLSSDTDIALTSFTASIRHKISPDQVRLMRWALQCLIEKYQATDGSGRAVDWPEWKLFLYSGSVCGFVCKDADAEEGSKVFHKILNAPGGAKYLTIRQLRELIHYIVRSERWGDMGGDRGGNTLWMFLKSDAAEAVCNRLSEV